jgi:hypothetical protein
MSTVSPVVVAQQSPPQRARFKADCVYGATGTGKTHQVALMAKRVWDKWKLRTRLVAGDSGGFDTLGDLVDDGIVLPVVVTNAKFPIEALAKISQGFWPDPYPDGELKLVAPKEEIGAYAFEGLTSYGDIILRHLSAHKTRLSQDPSYSYMDGKTEFSGTNQSYYGEVQNRLYEYVTNSSLLPVKDKVLWTALEGRGEDQEKNPTYGPSIAGKKAVGKAGQWFGNMLHLEMLVENVVDPTTKQIHVKQRRVMYTQPHADPVSKIPFPAKVRAPFNRKGDIEFFVEPDIAKLYDQLEALKGGK